MSENKGRMMWKNLLKKAWVLFWVFLVIEATCWILNVLHWAISVRWAWIILPPISADGHTFTIKLPPIPVWVAIIFVRACVAYRPFYLRLPKEIPIICWPRFTPKEEWADRLKKGWFPFLKNWTKTVRMTWWRRRKREFALAVAVSILAGTYWMKYVGETTLADYQEDLNSAFAYDPPVSTRVYDSTGREEICKFTLEDRDYIHISEVPTLVQNAFIAAEDGNFRQHDGIDLNGITRAFFHNLTQGNTKQGGSTIGQQVIKQVVLKTNERSVWRKVREVFLVSELEHRASKDKILEIYLNHVYIGRAYGIKAAARAYYGKNVKDLTAGEAAFLAGMVKAPSNFSPSVNYVRAKERQTYVLGRMRGQNFINEEQQRAALHEDAVVINNQRPLNRISAPYFCEHLRHQIEREYGKETVYKKGLIIFTTLNMKMQRAAEAAVQNGLVDLERRLGFNGPEKHEETFTGVCTSYGEDVRDGSFESAQVFSNTPEKITICVRGNIFPMHKEDIERIRLWEKTHHPLTIGDNLTVRIITTEERVSKKETRQVRFAVAARRTGGANNPQVLQAAMVVTDPKTGALLAMVGGYDFNENQFNMATQARRQTGSSVKPYIYLAALMRGKTVTDIVTDYPVCYPSASGTWCPTNYLGPHTSQQYMGTVDLRTALAKSLNSISVQLLHWVGVDEGIRTMRKVGIISPIERVLPIAIGALDVTPWEHTFGFTTIAAEGRRLPHQCYHLKQQSCDANTGIFILKVLNADSGELVYEYVPETKPKQVVPAADAYAMIYLMEGVVQFGTGRRVQELQRPAAGKTGTTNDFKDTWFMGFTTDLVVGVWVGRQRPITIAKEATGGSVALPIWLAFMKTAHPDTPPREFPIPDDIVFAPGTDGKLIPYQRGRVPDKYLK